MTGTELETFCEELNGGASIGETLLFQFINLAKAMVEQLRPWVVLRYTDTSKTVTTHSDILWQNDNGQAAICLMFGGDGVTPVSQVAVGGNPGPAWHVKDAGDFNGDGTPDILWQNDNGQAAVWLMFGGNGITPVSQVAVGGNPGPAWHVISAVRLSRLCPGYRWTTADQSLHRPARSQEVRAGRKCSPTSCDLRLGRELACRQKSSRRHHQLRQLDVFQQ